MTWGTLTKTPFGIWLNYSSKLQNNFYPAKQRGTSLRVLGSHVSGQEGNIDSASCDSSQSVFQPRTICLHSVSKRSVLLGMSLLSQINGRGTQCQKRRLRKGDDSVRGSILACRWSNPPQVCSLSLLTSVVEAKWRLL